MAHKACKLQMDVGYTVHEYDSKLKRKCLKKKALQPSNGGMFS